MDILRATLRETWLSSLENLLGATFLISLLGGLLPTVRELLYRGFSSTRIVLMRSKRASLEAELSLAPEVYRAKDLFLFVRDRNLRIALHTLSFTVLGPG